MTRLVDSHVHLDLIEQPEFAVERAFDAGVGRLLAVGIDIASSEKAIDFAKRHGGGMDAAIGIHPHDASSMDRSTIGRLRELASEDVVVAIGETGLDFYRDRSPREEQRRAFIQQMELAREFNKTVIVHSRESSDETLEILTEHGGGLTVVLHCFAMPERVGECSRAGYYMSMAGNITFKNAENLREASAEVPDELLLTETDSPFLTPVPFRGQKNQPANVSLVLNKLAELRGIRPERLAARIYENYGKAFHTL